MGRIDEIDFFRGIAVILMVIFHIVFDLNFYLGLPVSFSSGFWFYEGKTSALMFIFLAGISVNLSKNALLRGIKIFSLGMLITFITYLIDKSMYVKFGILHFIGLSYLFSYFFKKKDVPFLVATAFLSILIGIYFNSIFVGYKFLFPLGLIYKDFSSLDYYPVFPYLGVFLFGVVFYKTFYAEGKRFLNKNTKQNIINFIGKKSLVIYLIHQPVIIGILFLYKYLFN